MKSKRARSHQLRPRMRVICGREIAMGPGKVDLLALIAETGSIREAAEQMRMSYMRAWSLIRTINACFKRPLVESVRGGKAGGGAQLTQTGVKALRLYQQMESRCLSAVRPSWEKLEALLMD